MVCAISWQAIGPVVGLVPILGQLTQGAAFSRKNKDLFVCFQRAQLRKNCSALDR